MQLEDLQVILKVAEFRSITAAAASLDLRTATASAAIKRVESALGVDLFIRTTRQLRLSSAGERFIPKCEEALLTLELARQDLKEEGGQIDGELRIGASSDLGRNLVTPWLDELLLCHPGLSLKVNISDSHVDFYRDPVDIALRYGPPADANLYGFKICPVPRLLCAAPAYLQEIDAPLTPDDLSSHNGLFYQLHEIVHSSWEFHRGGDIYKVRMSGNRSSNDGDLVRRWCTSGYGLAIKSCLDMSTDLLSGKVLAVMQEYKPKSTELWLVSPGRQSITPTVRLVRDTLRNRCAEVLKQLVDSGILAQQDLEMLE
ncbi:LysR family transcriptional regulator [Microbulbifer sp. OS29]|uniref:LysR family transcriptional regulator n=1 Tax=Microbulbifer okhotskensis TaxID=2926617 RepID=A0A9X2J3Z8_9GAMM|nr:LysR family transcriptional regulator [Microbulbifer okhotskensis]MCO1332789.1 LysR family transcriptional regulator [Microbulbifer okhotskensis]